MELSQTMRLVNKSGPTAHLHSHSSLLSARPNGQGLSSMYYHLVYQWLNGYLRKLPTLSLGLLTSVLLDFMAPLTTSYWPTVFFIQLLSYLGFLIDPAKSELETSHDIIYIGARFQLRSWEQIWKNNRHYVKGTWPGQKVLWLDVLCKRSYISPREKGGTITSTTSMVKYDQKSLTGW